MQICVSVLCCTASKIMAAKVQNSTCQYPPNLFFHKIWDDRILCSRSALAWRLPRHWPILSCADIHYLLHCVITIYQHCRQTDRHHAHNLSVKCISILHVMLKMCLTSFSSLSLCSSSSISCCLWCQNSSICCCFWDSSKCNCSLFYTFDTLK